jgi:hypothetical protein
MRYDVTVIGNDEAAFEVSGAAATAGFRTLVVLPEQRHSSWIVSQALQRLTTELLSDRTPSRRQLFRRCGQPRLLHRLLSSALSREVAELASLLERNGADVVMGESRLLSRNRISVSSGSELRQVHFETRSTVIATGVRRSAMTRSLGLIPLLTPESCFHGPQMPRALTVLGGDDLGAGLAGLFSLFGTESQLLAHEDNHSRALLLASEAGVVVRTRAADLGLPVSGLPVCLAPYVVDCRRVTGFTSHLNLADVGVEPDEQGQLWCDSSLETWCEDLFGAGDVVGFACGVDPHPEHQARRIVNRLQHRLRPPHFLRFNSTDAARVPVRVTHAQN